jgi:ABC-type phosphate/phosphonate transport system substrate-binding protein
MVAGRSLAFALSIMAATGAAAGASSHEVAFYDPDANYDALPRIVKSLNDHINSKLPGFRFSAVNDLDALVHAVADAHTPYALLSSEVLPRLKKYGCTPLLVPEAAGTVFYRKILVDTGTGAANVSRKRIAIATSETAEAAAKKILDTLRQAGLATDGATVVATTKDFDALLGITFGQADAALVTTDSIDLLKTVNPAAVASLRTLWTSGKILRPVLVALAGNEDASERNAVTGAFTEMLSTRSGKEAMESLGFDRWVPYTPALLGKGD